MFKTHKKLTGTKIVVVENAHNIYPASENKEASSYRDFIVGAVVWDGEIWFGTYRTNSSGTQQNTYFRKELSNTSANTNCHYNYGAAVVYDGAIHLLGSRYSGEGTYHKVYDGSGSSFTAGTALPQSCSDAPAVVCDGKIHIFGDTSNRTRHYTWKTGDSSWTLVSTALPINMYSGLAVVRQSTNHIHILHGTDHYELSNGSWVSKGTNPVSFLASVCVAVSKGANIHVFSQDTHYIWNGSSWTTVQDVPITIDSETFAVLKDDKIHIVGGHNSERLEYCYIDY